MEQPLIEFRAIGTSDFRNYHNRNVTRKGMEMIVHRPFPSFEWIFTQQYMVYLLKVNISFMLFNREN